MKIIVRVLAEAQAPLLDRELIGIENVFIKQITDSILKELDRNSPYNRKWRSFKGEKLTHLDKSWKKRKQGWGLRIYNAMPYAKWLAEGTGIYGPRGTPITPTKQKALKFYYSFIHRWVVTRSVKGINPARFQAMMNASQERGTEIGVRKAMDIQERKWRGTLQTKLIKL